MLSLSSPAKAAADSVSSSTYKSLTEIQEQIGNNQLEEAYIELKALHQEVDIETIDEALVLQMLGYTEMSRNNYDEAIIYLKRSLSLGLLPESVKYNVGYMVAQLYAAQEKFTEALVFAKEWFTTIKEPTAAQYIFMANIFAQTQNYKDAIPYTEKAIAMTPEPKENWYQLLIASNFEVKQYSAAAAALSSAISYWPENSNYWEQLASVYMILEENTKGLATLQLAWKSGVLDKETSVKSMVQLAITQGIPEHAARLIVMAMEQNILPEDADYLATLANAWVAAKEYTPAITAFEKLAEVTEESEPYLNIANLYVEKAQWQPAELALNKALSGELEEPGKAWLVMGITMTEQKKFGEGLAAFRKARAFSYSEGQANNWLEYAADLQRQHNWITRNKAANDTATQ
ncbi:tetratricopeptide repeat protein [Colwellia echini]|uniref:Tetratricopeptide repeat protein n=2 Tax=Colwellia echini TaxID=1982103 RepID=A0ABY3MZT1_9GAMM|nr:tetratricopeptide repeat protein [Colwellia echini]